jgi:uncharacterized iron-regulated membrane protein
MRTGLSLVHRWLGGLVGLGLAMIGLTGTLLLWKPYWVAVAQTQRAATAPEIRAITATAERLGASYLVLPSDEFGVAEAGLANEGGAYIAHDGEVLAQWMRAWDRPETLLFDLHTSLLMGHDGETIVGWLGLALMLFVITGSILWWRTRKTFGWRLVPARFTRPAIIRHHRDIGVVLALPLLLLATTGALMLLAPLAGAVLAPLSPAAEVAAWEAAPPKTSGTAPHWPGLLDTARARFPAAEPRLLIWPDGPGEPAQIRMRQPSEWLPNGRTTLWFGGDGQVLKVRDATVAPLAVRVESALYPLHSAQLTGSRAALPLRLVLTLAGLGLTLLGSLAVVTFWRQRLPRAARPLAA